MLRRKQHLVPRSELNVTVASVECTFLGGLRLRQKCACDSHQLLRSGYHVLRGLHPVVAIQQIHRLPDWLSVYQLERCVLRTSANTRVECELHMPEQLCPGLTSLHNVST